MMLTSKIITKGVAVAAVVWMSVNDSRYWYCCSNMNIAPVVSGLNPNVPILKGTRSSPPSFLPAGMSNDWSSSSGRNRRPFQSLPTEIRARRNHPRPNQKTNTALNGSMNSFNQKNSKKDDDAAPDTGRFFDSGMVDASNIIYGLLWITFVTLSFTNNGLVPHGDTVELRDAQIFQSILENPTSPDQLNEIYFCLFNLFAIIPIILSCLLLPVNEIIGKYNDNNNNNKSASSSPIVSNNDLISPQPFVIASAAIGYFAMGIYLTLRRPPKMIPSSSVLFLSTPINDPKQRPQQTRSSTTTNENLGLRVRAMDVSWYTKNLWENSILRWLIVAFIIYLPFGSHTVSAIQDSGWESIFDDFLHLVSTSRFATVSCIDLLLLHITCISLIPYDFAIRHRYTTKLSSTAGTRGNSNNKDDQRGQQIAALAAIVPYLGTALYIAFRPSMKQ